ncbi:MAG: hypothetical protein KF905_09960 [Flavobacteriales bacterium]|nr:hypothetical protein [Flavobacteriales bacterium]
MSFTFHSWEDYGRRGDPWGFFLGLKTQGPLRWKVAFTRGAAGSTAEEQVNEEEHFIEWCTDRVIEAKLGRHILYRYPRPANRVEQYKLDRQVGSLGHQTRVVERQGELIILSWEGLGAGRNIVRAAISEDLQVQCQTNSMFMDVVGGRLLQDRLERYLLPARSRHWVDMASLVNDGAGMAIMCGEHDSEGSHHFFMTIH